MYSDQSPTILQSHQSDLEFQDELAASMLPEALFDEELYDLYYNLGIHGDFFDELEYDADDYYDVMLRERRNIAQTKRKSFTPGNAERTSKRRKYELATWPSQSTARERSIVAWRTPAMTRDCTTHASIHQLGRSIALFPDWRDRFARATGFSTSNSQTAFEPSNTQSNPEGEGDTDDDADDLNGENGLLALLRSKLGTMGLGKQQQQKLLGELTQALQRGKGADLDGLLDELTSSMLDDVEANPEAAEWLAEQGIDVGQENDEPLAHADCAAESVTLSSPKDSALGTKMEGDGHACETGDTFKVAGVPIAPNKTTKAKEASGDAIEDSSVPRKRKGGADASEQTRSSKRQQHNFAAPTASSSNRSAEAVSKPTTRSTRKKR